MRMLRLVVLLVTLVVCGMVIGSPVRAADLKITEMAVTTKISRNNPIDAVRRISHRSVKALYCFTRIVNPGAQETVIRHVWYKDGAMAGEQELAVKGAKWRTWSKKPVDAESVGTWRVEAVDSAGKVLKTVEFKVH
ncbi:MULTISPECIES: DUF2914 domain-containing protein [Geobacter]|uniref:DUF2914 domain-containing protein n=2 Tax=Geobacter TaxID=28231 RepID=A0A0C1U995_9BACT|nr:hypothetical protein A2G06_06635 [Geobacter anodireducens]KIE44140.1 hypothetical protein SE37_04420 [Geobacter soli]MBE2886832.1 DUF2914 domain-containing protein [Geobacter anodireducens]